MTDAPKTEREDKLILVTGATGYVGGRLLRALVQEGRRIRCLARRPEYLDRFRDMGVEVIKGDVLDPDSLRPVLNGVHTAYYLIHSMDWAGVRFGNRLVDSRTRKTNALPQVAFTPIRRIGGSNGWYFANWLWRIRGFMDILAGGVGMRRGRRRPDTLAVGDVVDCWRVEAMEPDRYLRLAAEMKLPGRAWLEFEVEPNGAGSVVRQTAEFDPIGFLGLAYWYLVYPLHQLVFSGMLRNLTAAAEAQAADPEYDRDATGKQP